MWHHLAHLPWVWQRTWIAWPAHADAWPHLDHSSHAFATAERAQSPMVRAGSALASSHTDPVGRRAHLWAR